MQIYNKNLVSRKARFTLNIILQKSYSKQGMKKHPIVWPLVAGNFWLEKAAGNVFRLLIIFKATIWAKNYILCLYLGSLWYIMNHWHSGDFSVAGTKIFFHALIQDLRFLHACVQERMWLISCSIIHFLLESG